MPIRAELRHYYRGPEWKATRERVLKRARYRCEYCRRPWRAWVFTYTWHTWILLNGERVKLYHMIWTHEHGSQWHNERGLRVSPWRYAGLPRKIRVKLCVCHRDGDPENMADQNLACWCDWCHLHHDQAQHRETRARRKDRARPILLAQEAT